MRIEQRDASDMPSTSQTTQPLGRHFEGCRVGFDLGGSDRKCAAVIDGKVVFSEEVPWNPYFQKDPQYHVEGINDSISRAAAKMPRVDAIGGSAAGIYVNNEVRVGRSIAACRARTSTGTYAVCSSRSKRSGAACRSR